MLKKEISIFLTAVMFYTRLPCPSWINHEEIKLNMATRYLTLIGLIVGGIASGIYWLASFIFPHDISIIFSMVSSIWLTGAFHEDGFSDVCDGFGGGWTKEQKLHIMKDSRLGTYGSIGLFMILLLKYTILSHLFAKQIIITLVSVHAMSRLTPIFIIYFYEYAREDASSKVKPIGKSISTLELLFAMFIALVPLFYIGPETILCLPIVIILQFILGKYFKKHLGGYTGDCLGASQQVTEIILYLAFYVLWNFSL